MICKEQISIMSQYLQLNCVSGNKSKFLCSSLACKHSLPMCKQQKCQCHKFHQFCSFQKIPYQILQDAEESMTLQQMVKLQEKLNKEQFGGQPENKIMRPKIQTKEQDLLRVIAGKKGVELNKEKIGNILKEIPVDQDTQIVASIIKYPKFWDKSQTARVALINVNKNSKQYEFVKSHFNASQDFEAQRIQNRYQYQKFFTTKDNLQQLYGEKLTEKYLFHGTRQTPPQKIYGEVESFNVNFSLQGAFGKGLYFAKQSKYSLGYIHILPDGRKSMLMCLVLTGFSQQFDGNAVINQPKIRFLQKKWRYDSVIANSSGYEIYAVFHNDRAYPLYLITFR